MMHQNLVWFIYSTILFQALSWKLLEDYSVTTDSWKNKWGKLNGPGGRAGHTFALVANSTKIVLFGGKDNDAVQRHIPKSYKIVEINGSLEFLDNFTATSECQRIQEEGNEDDIADCPLTVLTGLYYNDVWVYDLNCELDNSSITSSVPCANSTWQNVHEGGRLEACQFIKGEEFCSAPSERWGHGMASFNDNTILMYGGYSPHCGDYCDDLWAFDMRNESYLWTKISTTENGPGKRWKFGMVSDGLHMYVFGGYRLWHGFASDNSQENKWNSTSLLPFGGYLNDFWVYEKHQLETWENAADFSTKYGNFSEITQKVECSDELSCESSWPTSRAGHQLVYDKDLNGIWLHGGYTTYFPYADSYGAGSDYGTKDFGSGGFRPFPDHPFYLSDLWFFNLSTKIWTEIHADSAVQAPARMDHQMFKIEDSLMIIGGYSNNHHYDDMWLLNVTTKIWKERTTFVYPLYPPTCTDDLEYIEENVDCFELDMPKSQRHNSAYVFSNEGETYSLMYGIINKGELELFIQNPGVYSATDVTRKISFAATGLRQFVRQRYFIDENYQNITVFERCTSVEGEPTRGKSTHGDPVRIPQPRRKAPGWDGCRDRIDGNRDLEWELLWSHPYHRSMSAAIYSEKFGQVVLYGGIGHEISAKPTTNTTISTKVLSDMWVLNIHHCPNTCSNHGECFFGNCICSSGYHGIDCSNSSCPGDSCFFDDITLTQVCMHCCQSGWSHKDGDTYVTSGDVAKLRCTKERPGESHGVCDGFGSCQCEPSFIGPDCSIRDCPSECNHNGWCSVEFPVSRCVCNDGFFGEACQYQECLNNCSYPLGTCNTSSGSCNCNFVYNPYKNTEIWKAWGGEDCSFVPIFASSFYIFPSFFQFIFLISSMAFLMTCTI